MEKLIKRVLEAYPDVVKLSDDEIAKLEAYLITSKPQYRMLQMKAPEFQLEREENRWRRNHIRATIEYNERRPKPRRQSTRPSKRSGRLAGTRDAVQGPDKIVLDGRKYKCDLTAREQAFLSVAIRANGSVPIERVMNRTNGVVWKHRYDGTRATRNRISTFLRRLNQKLLDALPPIQVSFHLQSKGDFIVRG